MSEMEFTNNSEWISLLIVAFQDRSFYTRVNSAWFHITEVFSFVFNYDFPEYKQVPIDLSIY